MTCCGETWVEDEEWARVAEQTVKVRKVGGPRVVERPGGRGRIRVGDEVDLPEGVAGLLVAGGEFEVVKPAKKTEPAAPAKKES